MSETGDGLDRNEAPLARPGELCFLADQMVTRLGTWLRLLGYDTRNASGVPDTWLLEKAFSEERVILTRDRALSRARSVRIHFVEAEETFAQLREVVLAFGLAFDEQRVLTRCSKCNSPLVIRDAAELGARVPVDVRASSPEVRVCLACDHVYWHGSHTDRIVARLREICRPIGDR